MTIASIIFLIVTCTSLSLVHGSKMVFTASTSTITTALTQSLSINCSLESTQDMSNQFKNIYSITVTRGKGEVIASVSACNPATAYGDFQTLSVAGDVTFTTSPVTGYLSLTWSNPDHQQAGTYTCNINGLNADNQGVMLAGNLTVQVRQPIENELVDFIARMEKRMLANEELVQHLFRENKELKNKTIYLEYNNKQLKEESTLLQTVTKNLQDSNTNLSALVSQLETGVHNIEVSSNSNHVNLEQLQRIVDENRNNSLINIQELQKLVNELKTWQDKQRDPHYELNYASCGTMQDYMPSEGTGKINTVKVTFQTPYEKAPLVFVSMTSMDLNKDTNTRYWIGPTNVTPTGFDLVCGTWADTHIYGSGVTWIAIKS
ncbi:uncharacterized protein LOC131940076 isoform X2 [Physella acuta]|uniref:uncharacterized protein LOC131940076 isoform X2 n=1 Tax=Physella acuta TaxID=109671 RepID=UPI0027DB892E|nr:uncharacterized protein LOC131940076 isoform X2 [Physella acuta]